MTIMSKKPLEAKGDFIKGLKEQSDLLKQLQTLSPLAEACDYRGLASELQGAARALEAFFDGDNSVMVMAEDEAVRRNRLNLLGVLRNQASVLARFDNIQS